MANTIFMIHGMWGNAKDWSNYRPFFEARGYRCITPTLPCHDTAPQAAPDPRLGTLSLLDYAAALEQDIRKLGIKPIIMGHSMGGLLAQMLGTRGLAHQLVLLTPAAPAGILTLTPSVLRSFWSYALRWGFWKKPYLQPFADAAYSSLHQLDEQAQRKAYASYVPESGRAIFEIGGWPIYRGDANKVDESRIACPMLVVAGTLDRITPASAVRKVADKYGHVSTYKEFPDHAHWVLGEPGWEEVAEFTAEWLNQNAHR
jgi:pimeloyl-ACP methyl ester carboxylesterase